MSRPSATSPGGPAKARWRVQQRRPHARHGRNPRGALARLLGPDALTDLLALQPDLLAAMGTEAELHVQVLGDVGVPGLVVEGSARARCPA